MIFDPSSAPHLRPWLVRTLEPICDAEPGALADYILALLKHNVPENEMRSELTVQLEEFLEKECASFIDTLFTVLRTKSYLPYNSPTSSPDYEAKSLDTGIPIPLDGLISPSVSTSPESSRKRGMEHDARDGRPSAKGPRLSADGQFSRYGNGSDRSTGGWGGRGDRQQANGYGTDGFGMSMGVGGMNRRPQTYQPPDHKRGICRDYHNNGYCARGIMCKYSHGDDAVIPGQLYQMNGVPMAIPPLPFLPMFANGNMSFGVGGPSGSAYDPHESHLDMRPGRQHHRPPVLPRTQQDGSGRISMLVSGELPVIQDLTPAAPPDGSREKGDSAESSYPPNQNAPQQPSTSQAFNEGGFLQTMYEGMNGGGFPPMGGQMMDNSSVDMRPPGTHSDSNFGGRPRGRGTFGGEVHRFRPERRNDKTLVVEKIPGDKMSLELINGWFKRFGTVTNIAIDMSGAKALVSFSNHEEAHAAWKSEDAVFGNRFVKVFWHRPMEGHGQKGTRMLAASAAVVANMGANDAGSTSRPFLPQPSTTPRKPSVTPSPTASALAAKQQLLEKQIAEQKSLMASLSTATAGEKKTIMARLRKLGDEMNATPITPLSPVPSTLIAGKMTAPAATIDDHERRERERLDMELDLLSTAPEGEESAEELKAKLELLKAEAARLGISDTPLSRRGRGRGRAFRGGYGFYHGAMRGGTPRASMKLDNRPKKLLIRGVNADNLQAVRDWYETTGQLESVEPTEIGELIATFRTRVAAEQGLSKGQHIPTVGAVQLSWYVGKPNGNIATPSGTVSTEGAKQAQRGLSPSPIHHSMEEEVIASGWGEDDDGTGMGML